jgi:hypothetical protein
MLRSHQALTLAGDVSGSHTLILHYTSVSQSGFLERVSGVPRDENASWRKSSIGGLKFVCMNYNSCGDIRH